MVPESLRAGLIGRSVRAFAPAKLNLALRVTGRRPDGLHLLEMYNVLLDFGDELEFRFLAPGVRRIAVRIEGDAGVVVPAECCRVESNLASRAASDLFDAIGLDLGFEIELVKRIPLGTGMGGGSSDAAAVLRLIVDTVGPLGVPTEVLERTALALGADVPFFLDGRAAFVSGIGERIEPHPNHPLARCECVVVFPPISVPTPRAYQLYREAFPSVPAPGRLLRDEASGRDPREFIRNDLSGVVGAAFPPVRECLERLSGVAGCAAGMTGSGSALFVVPRDGLKLPRGGLEAVQSAARCPCVETTVRG